MVRVQQLVVLRNKQVVAIPRFVGTQRNPLRCCLHSPPPPSTSNTRDRAMACTPGIVAHASCSKGASDICGTDSLTHANEPWMGYTSLWAHPLPSPNNNGRPCRGSSKHLDLTSVDMLGGKPPMCASIVCPSHCSGRRPQSTTHATCVFVLVQLVSPTMACRTPRLELCVNIPARARSGNWLPIPHMSALKTHWPS